MKTIKELCEEAVASFEDKLRAEHPITDEIMVKLLGSVYGQGFAAGGEMAITRVQERLESEGLLRILNQAGL